MSPAGERHAYLGREDELERLADLLAAAADGRGRMVVVRGPAGTGTTATAQTLAEYARSKDVGVLWGAAVDGLRGRSFAPIAELLDDAARSADPASLYGELGDGAPALARIAPALRAALPAIPPPAPLDAASERLRLQDAVLGWFGRAARRRPLLLVIDDLQWADTDTCDLLEQVVRRLRPLPVLLLATWADYSSLSEGASADAPADRLLAHALVMDLPGLDAGATAALVGRSADRHISPAAAQLIQRVSDGQPLAAIQLYRHLLEEGMVGRPGGDELPAPEALPASLEDVLAWRLSRLSLETRSAIGALSCFPRPVDPAILAPVAGLTRNRATEALGQAVDLGLAVANSTTTGYAVAHERFRRHIWQALPEARRTEALGRAAEVLEDELGAEARQHAAKLAELYALAVVDVSSGVAFDPSGRLVDRAAAGLRHTLVAAEQARAASAFQRAADWLGLGVRLAEVAGGQAVRELVPRLAIAQAEAGRADAAVAAIEQGIGYGVDTAISDAAIATARALSAHGFTEAAERIRQLLANAVRTPDALTTARLELLAGRWQHGEAGSVSALFWVTAEEAPERVILDAGDESDAAELFAAQRARTHEETVRLLSRARTWRRPAALLRALHGSSIDLSTRLGLFREARSWADEYVAAAERYGSPIDHVRALLLAAGCRAVAGEFDSADELMRAADEAQSRFDPPAELADQRLLAELALAHYRDADWAALGAQIAERRTKTGSAGLLLAAEHAFAAARAGDEATAQDLLDDVLELASAWPPLTYLRDSALMVALAVPWELGRAQYAVRGRSLASLLAPAGAGGNHAATPDLAVARMRALQGQLAEARPLFDAARAQLEEGGLRPLRAIVDHDEAIALAASGPSGFGEAAALLETSAVAFEALGMAGWAGRSRQLLEMGFETAGQPGGRLHFTYPAGLSRREADIVRLLSVGVSLAEAATDLELDEAVAARHLEGALAKLGTDDPADLPRLARRHGLGGGV